MVILQKQLACKCCEIAAVRLSMQFFEDVFVLEVLIGQRIVVKPRIEHIHGIYHAIGTAKIALAHNKLAVRQRRFYKSAVDACLKNSTNVFFELRIELIRAQIANAFRFYDGIRLRDSVNHRNVNFTGNMRIKQRAFQRRFIRSKQRVKQNFRCKNAFVIAKLSYQERTTNNRFIRRYVAIAHDVTLNSRCLKFNAARRVCRQFGVRTFLRSLAFFIVNRRKIRVVDKGKHVVYVYIAIDN